MPGNRQRTLLRHSSFKREKSNRQRKAGRFNSAEAAGRTVYPHPGSGQPRYPPTGFLLRKLKGTIKNFEIEEIPAIQRKFNNLVWYEKGQFYNITKDGIREFAGYKLEPKGIVLGTEETMANVDFERAKKYGKDEKVVVEIIDIKYDKERTFIPSK